MQYRCYFFGANGQLVGADTITQESDTEARATAWNLCAQRAYAVAYDLRQGRRSVETKEVRTGKAPRAA